MRRGQRIAVIEFAIGGVFSVKGRPIPGGDAGLVVIGLFAGVIPDAVDLIGTAHLVDPGRSWRFRHRWRRRWRPGWGRARRQKKAKDNHGGERSQKSHQNRISFGAWPTLTDGALGCKIRGLFCVIVARGEPRPRSGRNGPVDHFERRTPRAWASGRGKPRNLASHCARCYAGRCGWVAERFKAPVLKTGVAETSP